MQNGEVMWIYTEVASEGNTTARDRCLMRADKEGSVMPDEPGMYSPIEHVHC